MSNQFDLFLSYATTDRKSKQWVPALTKCLERRFKVFRDKNIIGPADLWGKRIRHGLAKSSVMVAVLSKAYLKSEWCSIEWDFFTTIEDMHASVLARSGVPQGLIFPIILTKWEEPPDLTPAERRRLVEIDKRQHVSFAGQREPKGNEFQSKLDALGNRITEVLEQIAVWTFVKSQDGTNLRQFLYRLARATNVTIVGITHQHLASYLQTALNEKRQVHPDSFWFSLRIVFLHSDMLAHVKDELSDRRKRLRNAEDGRNAIRDFCNAIPRPETSIFEFNGLLPFIGALFEMEGGEHIVQVATLRPGFSTSRHLFMEFSSLNAPNEVAYYRAAFDEVVNRSRNI